MAKEKRDYQVIDADGRVVLSRIDMENDFGVTGASNGFGWSGGKAPFKVYCGIVGSGSGYGLLGTVPEGAERMYLDTGEAPDLEQAP